MFSTTDGFSQPKAHSMYEYSRKMCEIKMCFNFISRSLKLVCRRSFCYELGAATDKAVSLILQLVLVRLIAYCII